MFIFIYSQPDLAEETMSTDVMELKEGIYQQVNAKQIIYACNVCVCFELKTYQYSMFDQ